MNRRHNFLLAILFFFWGSLVFVGTVQAASSSPGSGMKGREPSSQPAWQQEWDNTLARAKQEGAVSLIVSDWPPTLRTILGEALKKKYGITLEYIPTARGSELVAKVNAEQRAGLYNYDVFGTGSTTSLNILKPQGLIGPVEPILILPEIKDPNVWRGGKLPFVDKDKFFLGMAASKQPYLIYNSDLVKRGEVNSYKDALKPQFVGKITLNDPTTSGSGAAMWAHLALDIWNLQEAKEYLRQLIAQQKAVIERDNRVNVEAVARGKYAVGLGTSPQVVARFIKNGSPIVAVVSKEGTNVTSGAGAVTIPVKMAHPNAGKVFVNWLLSKEGQSLFAQGWGTPSLRLDASTEGIGSLFLFQPGEKLFLPSEEKSYAMGEWTKISKQIIDEASKGN